VITVAWRGVVICLNGFAAWHHVQEPLFLQNVFSGVTASGEVDHHAVVQSLVQRDVGCSPARDGCGAGCGTRGGYGGNQTECGGAEHATDGTHAGVSEHLMRLWVYVCKGMLRAAL
jgi:hypothetical protein